MKLKEVVDTKIMDNSAFRQWFGDSKVVDENGQPLVLFHGTAYDFDVFDSDVIWASLDPRLASVYAEQRPVWDSLEDSNINVVPVYMKVERPFNADRLGHTSTIQEFLMSMLEQAKDNGVSIESLKPQTEEVFNILQQARIREESGPHYATYDFWYKADWAFGKDGAGALGDFFFMLKFDGIVYSEMNAVGGPDVMTWGTFYPNHVKSAIGNKSFSSDSLSIVESSK